MRRSLAKTPKPVLLLIAAFLCPTEFSLYLDTLRLPPHRVALLIFLPLALMKLMQQRGMRVRMFDLAFITFNVWTVGVYMHHLGQTEGLIYGGSLALEGLGGYLVARAWVRDVDVFQATLKTMMIAIAVAGLIALPETLLGKNFTHDFLRSVTGYVHPTAIEKRLGLTRAYGSFDHPIHYGTFCAALMAMFWFAAKNTAQRRNRTLLLAGATFLGLSSAPILCMLLQVAMLVWERATRGMASRTGLTLAAMTMAYIGASLVMERSPINLIATGMTLDSWTGFYRLQIWEHGLTNVYASPWVGIGLNDWVRPWWMVSSTVDAFWLVIAMRQGVPAAFILLLAVGLIMRAVVTRGIRQKDVARRRLARGWIMSLIALSLVGTTVHFWNVLYTFFFFVVGMGGWLADAKRLSQKAKARLAAEQRKPSVPPRGPQGTRPAPRPSPVYPNPAPLWPSTPMPRPAM
jgi:hypothetical protein